MWKRGEKSGCGDLVDRPHGVTFPVPGPSWQTRPTGQSFKFCGEFFLLFVELRRVGRRKSPWPMDSGQQPPQSFRSAPDCRSLSPANRFPGDAGTVSPGMVRIPAPGRQCDSGRSPTSGHHGAQDGHPTIAARPDRGCVSGGGIAGGSELGAGRVETNGGVFLLAAKSQCPVRPAVIVGSDQLYVGANWVRKPRVVVAVGEPLPPRTKGKKTGLDGDLSRGNERSLFRGEETSCFGGGGAAPNATRAMESRQIIEKLHRAQSRLTDSAAFFGIGLWQLLGRSGRHGPEEWEAYVDEWLAKGPEEFFGCRNRFPRG